MKASKLPTWWPFSAWILTLSVALLLLSPQASASTDNVLVARCHADGIDYSLYSLADAHQGAPAEGDTLSVITSVISPLSGLHLSTGGVYRPSLGLVELPRYWKQKSIPLAACQMIETERSHGAEFFDPFAGVFASAPRQDLEMYLQVYFIEGDPNPDVDIDQMIQSHQAFPMKVHIICTTRETTNVSPLACLRVTILDHIVPIDPPPHPQNLLTSLDLAPTIQSGLCGLPPTIHASVSIVQQGLKLFAVTSSGAVASEFGQNSCSQLLFNGSSTPLKLLRHDFSRDLAAFELVGALPAGLKPLHLSNATPDQVADGLAVQTLTGSAPVEVFSAESKRHFIPRVNEVLELRGSEFHAAIQGAAVTNSAGELSAIVSSEYLKIFPGSYTRPVRWSKSVTATTDHLIAIPASALADFLESMASQKNEPQIWLLDSAQDHGGLRIQSGKLIFSEDCPPMDGSQSGGQYPIGGIDPIGIGGDSANYRACKIQVRPASSATDPRFFRGDLQSWADGLWTQLLSENSVELDDQIWRDSAGLQRGFFYSAESFFQTIATLEEGHQIVELATRKGRQVAGLDAKLDDLRALAQKEREADLSIYLNNQFGDPNTENLLRRIFLVCTVLESEQVSTLTEADFKELTDMHGPFERGWGLLGLAFHGASLHDQLLTIEQKWAGR